jgi:hypothetical protein
MLYFTRKNIISIILMPAPPFSINVKLRAWYVFQNHCSGAVHSRLQTFHAVLP